MSDVILEIFQVPGSRSSTKSNRLLLVLRFFPSKDFMKIGDSIKSIRDKTESVDCMVLVAANQLVACLILSLIAQYNTRRRIADATSTAVT